MHCGIMINVGNEGTTKILRFERSKGLPKGHKSMTPEFLPITKNLTYFNILDIN